MERKSGSKEGQGRPRINLAMRVKEDSRRAGVAHEELQEMADDRQRWKERVVVRRSGRARRAPERY